MGLGTGTLLRRSIWSNCFDSVHCYSLAGRRREGKRVQAGATMEVCGSGRRPYSTNTTDSCRRGYILGMSIIFHKPLSAAYLVALRFSFSMDFFDAHHQVVVCSPGLMKCVWHANQVLSRRSVARTRRFPDSLRDARCATTISATTRTRGSALGLRTIFPSNRDLWFFLVEVWNVLPKSISPNEVYNKQGWNVRVVS